MDKQYTFSDLIDIISLLRSENGCPWDKVQTHNSLKGAMLEEAYEVVDAINNNDTKNLCEELGDVLLQVVFHSDIEKSNNSFDINNVIGGICTKMINRHPHIFGDSTAETAEQIIDNWEKNKRIEKGYTTSTEVLKAVPKALPSLIRAEKVLKKAKASGYSEFDENKTFDNVSALVNKLQNNADIEREDVFGELLLEMVYISTFLGVNAEFSLTKSTEQFINRFEHFDIDRNS